RSERSERLRSRDSLADSERILVGAGTVDRWHRHADLTEIDGQLTSVVIPVIQHERPERSSDWKGHHFPVAVRHAPDLREIRLVQRPKNGPSLREALLERRHQFRRALRARLLEFRYGKG